MVTFSKLGDFGRLGNQLFQVATVVSYSKKYNYDWGLPSWKFSEIFDGYFPKLISEPRDKYEYYQSKYKEVKNLGGNIDFLGYFQSEKYFIEFSDDIKKLFQPKKELVENLLQSKKMKFNDHSCVVHVRRGDYIPLNHFIGFEYFNNSIKKMREENMISNFFFVSDDIAWCRKNFKSPDFFFLEDSNEVDDFITITLFKNAIISNSSYSWWGAYLGCDKNIICPLVPFKTWVDCDDYYPYSWNKLGIDTPLFETTIDAISFANKIDLSTSLV